MIIFSKIINFFFSIFKKKILNRLLVLLGLNLIYKSRFYYDSYFLLEDAEVQIYSQSGEDGIIDYLITQLKIKKPNFIEIGVGDYSESNTKFLYETYYSSGLIIDCIDNLYKKVAYNTNLWKGNLKIVSIFINSTNVKKILLENCSFKVDLISIDIDGIDYWVLKEFPDMHPKIFVVEYNHVFGPNLEVTVPNISNFSREKYHHSFLCYGASLKAYINLMNEKGYYFLGVNRLRNNAFFISKRYPKEIYFPKINNLTDFELTNGIFRESRSRNRFLNYLSEEKKIQEILDCEVIDISKNYSLKKIKEII